MRRTLPLLLLVALAGCDVLRSDDGLVCTDDFRSITVRVVAPDGDPLPELTSDVTIPRTGAVLRASGSTGTAEGVYTVADDGDAAAIRGSRKRVAFGAFSTDWVATAVFEVGFDGCHVEKVSGPEVITARAAVELSGG